MQITPPFKINKQQITELDCCAEKLGVNKSKIARAAIQLITEKINATERGELNDLIAEIVRADKRSGY